MLPLAPLLDDLADSKSWGYRRGDAEAVEPTALAALALVGHGRMQQAVAPLDRLCEIQSADGSLGIYERQTAPHWTTAYAALAWLAAMRELPASDPQRARYKSAVVRAGE